MKYVTLQKLLSAVFILHQIHVFVRKTNFSRNLNIHRMRVELQAAVHMRYFSCSFISRLQNNARKVLVVRLIGDFSELFFKEINQPEAETK